MTKYYVGSTCEVFTDVEVSDNPKPDPQYPLVVKYPTEGGVASALASPKDFFDTKEEAYIEAKRRFSGVIDYKIKVLLDMHQEHITKYALGK